MLFVCVLGHGKPQKIYINHLLWRITHNKSAGNLCVICGFCNTCLTNLCSFCRHLLYSWLEDKSTLRSEDQTAAVPLEEEVCSSLFSLFMLQSGQIFIYFLNCHPNLIDQEEEEAEAATKQRPLGVGAMVAVVWAGEVPKMVVTTTD